MNTREQTLNNRMDFDHVVEILPDGSIIDRPDVYAPELRDDELSPGGRWGTWELLDGYSGQDRYNGPMMHQSEFIGGGMGRDILSNPGVYVALVNYCEGEDPTEWAVARLVEI